MSLTIQSEVYLFMDHGLRVQDSLEYIEKNLSDKISLDDLAKSACLSKYHYHRLFHKAVGESVNKYISKKRMENAARELAQTDQPIIEIALKYQYGSQESFSRAFKRVYDLTPGKYRKMFSYSRQCNIRHLHSYSNQITDIAA
jgi:AraC-like DNA-binding protein